MINDLYIQAGSPTEWVRPGGWVDIPSITSADTKFFGVYAVYETRKNNTFIGFAAGTFNCTVNWGDGSPNTTVSTISTVSKTYTYSAITSPILVDAYGENYKTVLVTITQNSGALTQFNFGSSTSIGTYNWLDIVMSWSTARFQFLKTHPILQRFIMYTGSFTGVNMNTFINYLVALKVFQLPLNLGNPTQASNVFSQIGTCELGDITLTLGGSATGLFSTGKFRKIGNVTLATSNNITTLFQSCTNLQFVGNCNFNAANNFTSIFNGCAELIKVGTITSTTVTNLTTMCLNCVSLREITFTNLTNVTTMGNPFGGCFSLQKLRVPNLKVATVLTDCAMERTNLVQVFTDLGTPATTQIITVTRNPGSADLTAADILIATSKNWTVTL
jgi:hypothetical protein